MSWIKEKGTFLWGVGVFLLMLFVAGFPQNSLAQSQSGPSLKVIKATQMKVFCTQFQAKDSSECVSGFPYPDMIILLDQNTGLLYLQTPVTVIDQFPCPTCFLGYDTRERATGKIKTCLLGREDFQFQVNSFPPHSISISFSDPFPIYVRCP